MFHFSLMVVYTAHNVKNIFCDTIVPDEWQKILQGLSGNLLISSRTGSGLIWPVCDYSLP